MTDEQESASRVIPPTGARAAIEFQLPFTGDGAVAKVLLVPLGLISLFSLFVISDSFGSANTILLRDRALLSVVLAPPLVFVGALFVSFKYQPPRVAVVGAEGVRIGRRFIAYSSISRVCRHWRLSEVNQANEYGPPTNSVQEIWSVSLVLVGGEVLDVTSKICPHDGRAITDQPEHEERGSDLAGVIEAARATWVAQQGGST